VTVDTAYRGEARQANSAQWRMPTLLANAAVGGSYDVAATQAPSANPVLFGIPLA
jgi:hypothetical protein